MTEIIINILAAFIVLVIYAALGIFLYLSWKKKNIFGLTFFGKILFTVIIIILIIQILLLYLRDGLV